MLYLMTVIFFLTDSLQFLAGNAARSWPCSDPQVCLCLTGMTMCKDQDLPQTNTHVTTLLFEALRNCGCSTCPQGFAFSPKELHSSSVATVYASSRVSLLSHLYGQMSMASTQRQTLIHLFATYQCMRLTGCLVCCRRGKHEYTWCKMFPPGSLNGSGRDGAKHAGESGEQHRDLFPKKNSIYYRYVELTAQGIYL